MNPVRSDLAPLVGTERVACGLRLAVGVLLLAMTLAFEPAVSWLAVAAIVLAVGWSALMFLALRSDLSAAHVATLAGWSYWFDVVLALTVYGLFLGDPVATPVAGVPLLAYRLALRYGTAGVVAGAVAFVALVAGRIAYVRLTVGEFMVRPPMLLAWALVAVVVLMLAWQARSRSAAVHDDAVEPAELGEPARGASYAAPEPRAGGSVGAPGSPDLTPSAPLPASAEVPSSGTAAAPVVAAAAPAPTAAATSATGDERLDSLAACLTLGLEVTPTPLSHREVEVLVLLGQGLTYNAIAGRLFISQSTVRNHVHNIRTKLALHDKDQLMTLARVVAARSSAA